MIGENKPDTALNDFMSNEKEGTASLPDGVVIRQMMPEDYDGVKALWMTIDGFGIRSIDDSREGVEHFIARNPDTSVVADQNGTIKGEVLCGSDGRRGTLYHVCVAADMRRRGIGTAMVRWCIDVLRADMINKISLIAFRDNDIGNSFWKKNGWKFRDDLNYYDYTLNPGNSTVFNGNDHTGCRIYN